MKIIQLENGLDMFYPIPALPVGFIYQTTSSTSPATIFGGAWVRIQDVFLQSANASGGNVGDVGGAKTVTLTTAEMPSHYHGFTNYNSTSSNAYKGTMENAAGYNSKIDVTTDSTGGGKAHENMPPYLAVYTWQKVSD